MRGSTRGRGEGSFSPLWMTFAAIAKPMGGVGRYQRRTMGGRNIGTPTSPLVIPLRKTSGNLKIASVRK